MITYTGASSHDSLCTQSNSYIHEIRCQHIKTNLSSQKRRPCSTSCKERNLTVQHPKLLDGQGSDQCWQRGRYRRRLLRRATHPHRRVQGQLWWPMSPTTGGDQRIKVDTKWVDNTWIKLNVYNIYVNIYIYIYMVMSDFISLIYDLICNLLT
jgi:hypothetical protein